jgi:hypothetical protein
MVRTVPGHLEIFQNKTMFVFTNPTQSSLDPFEILKIAIKQNEATLKKREKFSSDQIWTQDISWHYLFK